MDVHRTSGPQRPGQATGPVPAPSPSISIPDHKLLQCIGRGSYGEVWLAQNMMGRYRAVKIVHRKSFEDQRPFERELSGIRKFEPISRSHDGFIDVLHIGINEEAGYFYYVMELGDDSILGQDIDPERYSPKTLGREISTRGKLSFQACLQLGLALSQALSELHRHGLVHRDVKPSNIIYVNGTPKLADIGLVAELDAARSFVGTEGFIPPEGPGTVQADIYSLGKVLYEASTGKDRQDFPELPSQWDTSPEHDAMLEFNEVVLQACKNDPRKRYQSAADMQADLVLLANGKSVRRLRLLERRWARVKRGGATVLTAALILAAILYQIYRERQRAAELRQQRVGGNIAYASRAVEAGDLLGALPYLADAWRLDRLGSEEQATHRLRFAAVLAQCPKLSFLGAPEGRVERGAFSPDGRKILLAPYCGKARLCEVAGVELNGRAFGHREGLCSAVFSPDGQFILTAHQDGAACLWEAATLQEVHHLTHPDQVYSAEYSPDGRRLVTTCRDGHVRVWSARSGEVELDLNAHTNTVLFALFSPDGRRIASMGYDQTARLWDATTGSALGPILPHGSWVTYAAFSPDGERLVTACLDRKARVWEVATGKRIPPDLDHLDGIMSVRYSPDGCLLATASLDGTVRLWRADGPQALNPHPILRAGERVLHAGFSPDSRRILVTCADGPLWLWDLAGAAAPARAVRAAFSENAERFLAWTNDSVRLWNYASATPITAKPAPDRLLKRVELIRNGKFVLTFSAEPNKPSACSLSILDAATGQAIAPALDLPDSPAGARLSEDGKRLVTFNDRLAAVWEVGQRQPVASLTFEGEPITAACFSPAGERIAATSGKQVRVWQPRGRPETLLLLEHPVPVRQVEFSPEGLRLVTCCADSLLTKCSAQVWDAVTGRPLGPPLRHADGVLSAAFSPDGRRVVTASEDFTAMIWNAADGRQLTPALRHHDQVQSAAFSPDGKWVVTASSDRTARIWSAETGDPITPPLRHPAKLLTTRFLPRGEGIVTLDWLGNARIWELGTEKRSVAEIAKLASVLSGGMQTASSHQGTDANPKLEVLWRELQDHGSPGFHASAADIVAWHESQAEECEIDRHWYGAVFHLDRLVSMGIRDREIPERLARAKAKLEKRD